MELVTLKVGDRDDQHDRAKVKEHPDELVGTWDDIDQMLQTLDASMSQKNQQVTPSSVPCADYDALGFELTRNMLFCIRDQGQFSLQHLLNHAFVKMNTTAQSPEILPLFEGEPDHCCRALDTWVPFPAPLMEKFVGLQDMLAHTLSEMTQKSTQMLVLVKNVPEAYNPLQHVGTATTAILRTRAEIEDQEQILGKTYLNQVIQVRTEAVRAYISTVEDAVRTFTRDLLDMLQVYERIHEALSNKESQIQATDPFPALWLRIAEAFRIWLESLSDVLPSSLQWTVELQGFLSSCDAKDDDCCVRRVRAMQDTTERIRSTLNMKKETLRSSVPDSAVVRMTLEKEMQLSSEEWSTLHQQLTTVQEELQNLSQQRIQLWTEKGSDTLQDLQSLEERQQVLEKRQEQLTSRISTLQSTMERLRRELVPYGSSVELARVINVLSQVEEWQSRLSKFLKQCDEETQKWESGRGIFYRMKVTVEQETLHHMRNLYATAQQKIDGSGYLLAQIAQRMLLVIQTETASILSGLAEKRKLTESSVLHYERRVAVDYPQFSELLFAYRKLEEEAHHLRGQMQCMQAMSETVSQFSTLCSAFTMWRNKQSSDQKSLFHLT